MLNRPRQRTLFGPLEARWLAALCASILSVWAAPQEPGQFGGNSDIPKVFSAPTANQDYVKREVMIPMRDGVKLHTVVVVPKGAQNAPILLTRTPYNASKRTARNDSPRMIAVLPQGDEVFVEGGYIRVFQDVRGKYKSEGDSVMTRPVPWWTAGWAMTGSTTAHYARATSITLPARQPRRMKVNP